MPLIDIGANLTSGQFDSDREAVIARARAAGVETMIVTGTSAADNAAARRLAAAHPGTLYATAGLHPHHAEQYSAEFAAQLRVDLRDPLVVAAGEMGLDFYRDLAPRPCQQQAFSAQLELAAEAAKPVFLHQRDAHPSMIAILREFRDALVDGVVHCFTDTREALYDYLDLGLSIGITGWVCDQRRGAGLRALIADIPAERLMIETDAPYLLPHTVQPRPASRRNEPALLPYVLATIAALRPESSGALAALTSTNARRFFRLPPPH
jgi:TatD DNase family protein